jgi:pimeloyl-ACP methyl ester carboxylesterase
MMRADGPNPEHMQQKPRSRKDATALPLVLIHDGGGTTAGFWALGRLQRDVYVVHNPHFWSGQSWEGGIDEMARHYLGLIRKRGIKGRIVLGGWSLGGFLALAIARMVAASRTQGGSDALEIAGLLLVDSPHYEPWTDNPPVVAEPLLPDMPPKVRHLYDMCEPLLEKWHFPRWGQDALGASDVLLNVGTTQHIVSPNSVLYKPMDGDWAVHHAAEDTSPTAGKEHKLNGDQHEDETCEPPIAILLRCVDRSPALDHSEYPCRVDLNRDSLTLGWGPSNYEKFIKVVLDTRNGHYTVFDRYDRVQVSFYVEGLALWSSR